MGRRYVALAVYGSAPERGLIAGFWTVMEEIAYADELWQKRGQGAQQKEAERQVQDTEVEQRTTTQSSANAVESPTPEQPAPITVRRPGYYM